MEDKNRFSILLEHLLEVAEVKNYTLAKRLQYDVSYISKWVSGRMLPAKKTEKRVMEGISACVVDEAPMMAVTCCCGNTALASPVT